MKCVLIFLLRVSPGARASLESCRSCSKNFCQPGRCQQHKGWVLWPTARIPCLPRTEVLHFPAEGDCWQQKALQGHLLRTACNTGQPVGPDLQFAPSDWLVEVSSVSSLAKSSAVWKGSPWLSVRLAQTLFVILGSVSQCPSPPLPAKDVDSDSVP